MYFCMQITNNAMKKLVSILVPCYNEEASLPTLYEEVRRLMDKETAYDWELFFVNDGSRDRTMEIIKELYKKDSRISYVDLARNFGKENAMLAGFDHVKGDCMVIMDADLQDPPSLIPDMLKYWEEGYDDVYAKRNSRGKESWLRRKLSMLFYTILDHSTRYDVLRNVGDFRLLDRSCIEALKQMRETERNTKGMYSWIGFRKKGIYYQQKERQEGQSKWGIMSLINLALNGIMSYTTAPLRLASILGLIVSTVAFAYLIYIIVMTNLYGDPVQGYPTIMVTMLFLGGVQLLSLGILGEYIARIFNEVKGRPGYFISSYNGKKTEK